MRQARGPAISLREKRTATPTVRYRFEFVDDDQPRVIAGELDGPLDAGYASTLRTALGYFHGWDLVLGKPIGNNFLVGVKYAYYDASGDALNRARNSISGQAFDLEKAWAYVQFKF